MYRNLDFQNDPIRSVFWIICSISWISFIVTNLIGLIKLVIASYTDADKKLSLNIIWGFLTYYIKTEKNIKYYYARYFPIEWDNYYYSTIFLIIFLLALVSFALFILKTTFQRDELVFNGLIGTYSKFHFIPLICGTCLFLSGIFKNNIFKGWNDLKNKDYIDGHLAKYVSDLIFSFLGAASLTFIKKTIKLDQPFYIVYVIKDGFFSILLALFTYSFFYASAFVGYLNKLEKCLQKPYSICYEDKTGAIDTLKNCGTTFALLVGLVNLGIAGYLKDFIISAMNAVIYLGCLIFFYSISGKRKDEMDPPFSEGILDIILFICSIVELVFLFYLKIKNLGSYSASATNTPLAVSE